jgi:hypothetical protein
MILGFKKRFVRGLGSISIHQTMLFPFLQGLTNYYPNREMFSYSLGCIHDEGETSN